MKNVLLWFLVALTIAVVVVSFGLGELNERITANTALLSNQQERLNGNEQRLRALRTFKLRTCGPGDATADFFSGNCELPREQALTGEINP